MIVEFSDTILGNRFGSIKYTNLSINGKLCGVEGLVSSHHNRKFMWSGDGYMTDEVWCKIGACADELVSILCSSSAFDSIRFAHITNLGSVLASRLAKS